MTHTHPVIDTDKHFIIDPITRTITNQEEKKNVLIQNDHNSERFSFEIPKEVDGHSMLECDRILIHYINVNSNTKEAIKGVYEVDDIQIGPDESTAIFTWLVSENATSHAGSLNFLIEFACTNNDISVYRWHTGINSSLSISTGMNNATFEDSIEPYIDIIAQWKAELFSINYAYEAALNNGFDGTEEEWLASLQGPQGEKGEKGDPGESGVTTPLNSFFSLSVDADGNLYANYPDDTASITFELDDEGNLYAIIPEE